MRRFADEPMSVPDGWIRHLRGCRRCQEHQDRAAVDAGLAHELLARPLAVPDVDRAWEAAGESRGPAARRLGRRVGPWRFTGAAGVVAVSGALAVGAAAAASLVIVFSPTHVAPVQVTPVDLQSFGKVLGLQPPQAPSSGVGSWSFGTVQWVTRPHPVRADTLKAAEVATGLTVSLPAALPSGVQGPTKFVAEPAASATVTFDAAAGPSLEGSVLTVNLGPAVLAEYGGSGLPTLAVVSMQRPTATSTGATTAQLESFLLGQPGFPQDLSREIRLLGNLGTVLPVPTPRGFAESSVTVSGAPGILLAGPGGAVNAVVWEDHGGMVRAVGGLLDGEDVLGVARQLG
ncbi:MAG: hypothetical protein ACRDWN_07000 [Acidimicrobiales bacterium]